jgi:hypothetical protein
MSPGVIARITTHEYVTVCAFEEIIVRAYARVVAKFCAAHP